MLYAHRVQFILHQFIDQKKVNGTLNPNHAQKAASAR